MATSRRTLIKGIAGSAGLGLASFSRWSNWQAYAQAPAPAGGALLTRHDVSTAEGQKMVEKYARAVAIMMDKSKIPESSPTSWLFQWYTHSVFPAPPPAPPPSTNKTKEIARVYAGAPPSDPHRLLALAMWSSCQAHEMDDLPQDEDMFLPWHRMYVYYFERIIRKVLNDNTFTLPYWDYTTAGKRALPEQFRMKNDPVFKSLYRENRNNGSRRGTAKVNAGEPIDKNRSVSPLNLAALSEATYQLKGVKQGFNLKLDSGLHGSVHVLVGDTNNMGNVPWAARDPIFWMHHCNIDRLWTSWNAGGRPNPGGDWLTQSFAFADENGVRVDPVVDDFKDNEKIKDGPYKYDKLEPVPPLPPAPAGVNLVASAPSVIASQAQPAPISLSGAAPVQVSLAPAAVPLSTHLQAGGANKRVYLVLKDLQAQGAPGILYDVYLDAPGGGAAPSAEPVGTLNFFDVAGHGGSHGGGKPKFRSYDVTDQVSAIGQAGGTPKVRIAPAGTPAANAKPLIGSVSLVRQ